MKNTLLQKAIPLTCLFSILSISPVKAASYEFEYSADSCEVLGKLKQTVINQKAQAMALKSRIDSAHDELKKTIETQNGFGLALSGTSIATLIYVIALEDVSVRKTPVKKGILATLIGVSATLGGKVILDATKINQINDYLTELKAQYASQEVRLNSNIHALKELAEKFNCPDSIVIHE